MPDDIEKGPSLANMGAPSWRVFFERHHTFIARVVRRFGGRTIDVEDAVQDVCLLLFQRLHEFEGHSQLTTWIYRICANVGSEHRRRSLRRERTANLLQYLPFVSAGPRTPEREAQTANELQLVEKILATMSEKRREAFILCELEELTGEEASQILGIPLATVRTRVHYARQDFLRQQQLLRDGHE